MTSEVTWNKIFILTYPHCEFNNKDIRLVSSDGVSPRMSLLLTLNRYLPAGKGSEQLILEHLGVAPSRSLFSRKAFSHRWKLKIKGKSWYCCIHFSNQLWRGVQICLLWVKDDI